MLTGVESEGQVSRVILIILASSLYLLKPKKTSQRMTDLMSWF